MERSLDLRTRLDAGLTRACRVLSHLEADFVTELELESTSEDVRIEFAPTEFTVAGATWQLAIAPIGAPRWPAFAGELRARGSSRGTDLTLTGTYRVADDTPAHDRIRMHINACDVVHAFLDDLVSGIDTTSPTPEIAFALSS